MEGLRLAALEGPGGGVEACLPLAGGLPLLPVAAALGELGRVDSGGLPGVAAQYARGEAGGCCHAPQPGPGGRRRPG
jgi:hypothetical protein